MNRLFSKLHVSALIQSNAVYYRDFASATYLTRQNKTKLPKPTPNAYALFVKTKIQKGISTSEQFSGIAKEWKASSDEEKKKFMQEAVKLRKDAVAKFCELTKKQQEEQFVEVAKSRADLKNNRRLRAYRKFRKETNCPTRPLNAFMLYRQEKYPVTSKKDIVESAKKAAEAFKSLSAEEKKPYLDKYNQESEAYKAAYEKWHKVHGENYEKLKKEHAKTKKVATKSIQGKKSMGLMSRLKNRTTKRKDTPKRKKTTKVTAGRR
uniref:HMG box domain-containing protein n=1 Tax=Panagrolaimus sp. ES5 TaxID=591445 RepID=A0AC34FTL7_9BILA